MTDKIENRTIIFHYHLFKNAGTSVDEILIKNFGDKWITKEFSSRANPAVHENEIKQWILDNPDALAFSSHTAEMPIPKIPGIHVIPVIFVRHPIDRIASAYSFEKKQNGHGFGSVLARNTDLKGYCEVRLALQNDRQCRNFQTARFCRYIADKSESELNKSLVAVDELPFVGVVEDFEESIKRLESILKRSFGNFISYAAKANVSRDLGSGINEKIKSLKAQIGPEFFEHLMKENNNDILLYNSAKNKNIKKLKNK